MKLKWKSFGNHFRRVGALLSALLMICCLTAPALAATENQADMPSQLDFLSHLYSWYVWKYYPQFDAYEILCEPLEFDSDGYAYASYTPSYTVSETVHRFSSGSDYQDFSFPNLYELYGSCGSWRYYPSFPLGGRANFLKIYPVVRSGFSEDLISQNRYFGSVCPSPDYFSLTNQISASDFSFDSPMLGFNQILYPVANGAWQSGSTHGGSNTSFRGLNSSIFSSQTSDFQFITPDTCPVIDPYILSWDRESWKTSSRHFDRSYSFPSSEAHVWFCLDSLDPVVDLKPNPDYLDPFDSRYLSSLEFVPTLFVRSYFLPSGIKVGDWISKATLEDLQDQLVNDFDVNSDTLKNSKQNFDSWQNSNTIDTDVANTGLDIINALMQNVGQFAFIVSLLCFGAVVLRVLIRKAVEG